MTAALEGDEWSAARPGRTLPPGKNRYPFYTRLGGPHRDSIPDRPDRSSVAITTELPGPQYIHLIYLYLMKSVVYINTHTFTYTRLVHYSYGPKINIYRGGAPGSEG